MRPLLLLAALSAVASAATAQDVSVSLAEWTLRASRDTVKAGSVTFQVTNGGAVAHALQIVGPDVDKATRQIAAREGATLTLSLKPGTYEIFCPLAEGSHKTAGMKGTLVVTASASPPASGADHSTAITTLSYLRPGR